MSEQCGGCRFFMHNTMQSGFCRRFPPDVAAMGQPVVDVAGWCGEYQHSDKRVKELLDEAEFYTKHRGGVRPPA